MRSVLHIVGAFLARSEVFLYTYLTAHRRFEATVLCRRIENEKEFPFARVVMIRKPETKLEPAWWLSRACTLVGTRSPWQYRVERFVDALKPDIIHAHFGPNGCAILGVAQSLKIPLVTSFYGVDISVLPYRKEWHAKYAALFEGGNLFLTEGPEMLRKAVHAGAPAERTKIQRIAIAVDRYPRWTPLSLANPTVLFVGRMVEKKGVLFALKAFLEARRTIPGLTMRLIGDGPDRGQSVEWVAAHDLVTSVTFLGMQSHERVLEELSRAHALIHPSTTAADGDSEGGAPTILLEAQAIGTPIVSTEHADIPNIVARDPSVRLCRERDVKALAVALVDVITAGRAIDPLFVRTNHSVAIEIDALEDKYEQVARARSASASHMQHL